MQFNFLCCTFVVIVVVVEVFWLSVRAAFVYGMVDVDKVVNDETEFI